MKIKRFLLTGAVVVSVMASFSTAYTQFRIGPKAGVNISNLSVAGYYYHFSTYVGPIMGGIIEFDLSNTFFVRAEPAYTQKGASYWRSPSDPAPEQKYVLKMDYLELPIMAGVQVHTGSFRFYFVGGPDVAYTLTNGFTSTDFALDAGVGVGINLNQTIELVGDVRYSSGQTNINSKDVGVAALYTRGIQPTIGVLFSL